MCSILLLIGALALQIKKNPFYDQRLNNLESSSLSVQIAIIYFGLYYQAGKNDDFVKSDGTMYGIFILILVASVQFITIFILRIRIEILKRTVEKSSLWNRIIFRIFSCGRIKDKEAFMKEHKIGVLLADEMLKKDFTEDLVDNHL